jgi:hypothetical protein
VARHGRRSTDSRAWAAALYFLGCPWCVSIWIAIPAALFPVLTLGMPTWWIVPIGLAASMLTGLFAPLGADEIDIEDEVSGS